MAGGVVGVGAEDGDLQEIVSPVTIRVSDEGVGGVHQDLFAVG